MAIHHIRFSCLVILCLCACTKNGQLYGVTRNDMLYLPEERRTYIW